MLSEMVARQRPVVIDGGLSTALGLLGHDLAHPLWTARLLADRPEAIVEAHRLFVEAGAELVISASYQASIDGFLAAGATTAAAAKLLGLSTALARSAGVPVAASIGPYGASLADGSEYRGAYPLSVPRLTRWHEARFDLLVESAPDLLAVETIPCVDEVLALRPLLVSSPIEAWVSFTCISGGRLASGEDLAAAVEVVADLRPVVAVGVNCTHPSDVTAALARIREVCDLPLVAYPNAGGVWDAGAAGWVGERVEWIGMVTDWLELGARIVGGCCGCGPDDVRRLRALVG